MSESTNKTPSALSDTQDVYSSPYEEVNGCLCKVHITKQGNIRTSVLVGEKPCERTRSSSTTAYVIFPHSHRHSHMGVVRAPRGFLFSDLPSTVNFPNTLPVRSGDFKQPQLRVCKRTRLPSKTTTVFPHSQRQSHLLFPFASGSAVFTTVSSPY